MERSAGENAGEICLHLTRLANGMPALTAAAGATLAEAAAVCLEDRQHASGVLAQRQGSANGTIAIRWNPCTEQMRLCHRDLQEATERGACGVALLYAREALDLPVVERSVKGTGFDYWLGEDSDDELVLAQKIRLEVSGILAGDARDVSRRVAVKREQIRPTDHLAPAIIAVVEFSRPVIHLEVVS